MKIALGFFHFLRQLYYLPKKKSLLMSVDRGRGPREGAQRERHFPSSFPSFLMTPERETKGCAS